MICLSKNLTDEYVNLFAKGANLPIHDYDYDFGNSPILIRSMGKRKLIHWCWENKHTFYYMDSGYVGNYKSKANFHGWKLWHRIVKNDVQHGDIIERPDDRWKKLNTIIEPRKEGMHILLVTPSEKPCKFYNIERANWIKETIKKIKKYTDRPIIVRDKAPRQSRLKNSIYDDLTDAHALVTYQSIAAVESVLYGVPAFTCAPTAADPVSSTDLSLLENPYWPDDELRHKWAHHLAYGQFHNNEFKDGSAYKILKETE